jgi:hypothetical protein
VRSTRRVVAIQPERHLLLRGSRVELDVRQRRDVAIEPPTFTLERAVIDISVAHVRIEYLVETLLAGIGP